MSGSGGGSSSAGVNTPCNRLMFKTDLASPKPAALRLNIGDILDIELIDNAIVAIFNGEIVGGIACKESSRLAHCLSLGNFYQASVLNVNLGRITISLFPR